MTHIAQIEKLIADIREMRSRVPVSNDDVERHVRDQAATEGYAIRVACAFVDAMFGDESDLAQIVEEHKRRE